MTSFTIIGLPGNEAADFLARGDDVCFGKHFAKTASECIQCRAPVIKDGKLLLMKDLCAMTVLGEKKLEIVKLTSKEVLERLERGVDLRTIFREILGSAPVTHAGATARQLLVDRLMYLRSLHPAGLPETVPKLKDLVEE
jgi:hypothetical protein